MRYLLFALLLLSAGIAQAQTEATAKAELKIIHLAYESWNSNTTTYSEPQDYIVDPKTKKITGQNFLNAPAEEKYIKAELSSDSTSATFRSFGVTFTWDTARITGVKIEGLTRCEYTVEYDKTGAIVKLIAKDLVNKTFRYVHALEFTGGLITKITRFENPIEGKKTWIRCIKTFERKGNETITKCITYKSNLPNKPENIFSTLQQSYKKTDSGSYATMFPYGEVIETAYNSDNQITQKQINNKGKIEKTIYTYKDKKLFKVDLNVTQGGVFLEHTITLYFSLTDQASFVQDYEKTKGTYKFDEKGNLILEARDNKYRVKKDGVWGPWIDASPKK